MQYVEFEAMFNYLLHRMSGIQPNQLFFLIPAIPYYMLAHAGDEVYLPKGCACCAGGLEELSDSSAISLNPLNDES